MLIDKTSSSVILEFLLKEAQHAGGRSYADPSTALRACLSLPPSIPTLYHYDDPAHVHAVTSVSDQSSVSSYQYDANGNMTCRVEDGITYKQDYNFENLLSAVHKMNGTCVSGTVLETTSFVYDGDGNPSASSGQAS